MVKKIKKIVTVIAIVVVSLIVLVLILFTLFGNKMIKTAIETAGPKVLGVTVTVEDISLSLLRGKLDIKNLVIGNPEGYANPTMLELGEAHINLSISSLLGDTVEISEMTFDKVSLTMEQKSLKRNNIQDVMDNIPKPAEEGDETPDEPAAKGQAKKLVIGTLDITNSKVNAKVMPLPGKSDTVTITIPAIHMKDLGKGDGISGAELTKKILSKLLSSTNAGLSEAGAKTLEAGKEAGKDILDAGKEATEGVLNIFKKKEDK